MARTIATIGGIALAPGVSKNRRMYSAEHIQNAVAKGQQRIESGDRPMVMLTHHGAGDDSTQIAARLSSLSLDDAGRARYTAEVADTGAGHTIASLTDTTDGKPAHLDGVSIRGYWLGTVRKVKGPDGEPVETADGLELDGLDFTRTPGVDAAGIDTFAWAKRAGRSETTERIAITESVQEARVTISEETTAPEAAALPSGVLEAARAALVMEAVHEFEDGLCVTCEYESLDEAATPPMSKRGSGISGAGGPYADPGYQGDKKQRYQLDTKAHALAAWRFIGKADNAKAYTAAQLKRVKGRIIKALKSFGVTPAAEGWIIEPPRAVAESVAEFFGGGMDSASTAGSWCIRASNGPVSLDMSSYCMDPADLDVILRAAADAACAALKALDPDMDGDIDLPGVGAGSDPDHDAPGESAPPATVTETAADPDPATEAGQLEEEEPAMAEPTTATPAAETVPPVLDAAAIAEAAIAAYEEKRQAKKAAKRAALAAAATETAAPPAPPAPAAPAPVTETADQRMARLAAIADQQVAAAAAREGLALAETDEQIMARLVEERLVPLRQAQAEGGGVQRKGLEAGKALEDAVSSGTALQEATNDELRLLAGKAYGPAR